jgi:hypothetical protein
VFLQPDTFYQPWISCAIYIFVAVMWLIPDRRIELALNETGGEMQKRPADGKGNDG